MASVQLITRLISETGLSSEKLRTGKLENKWEQLSTKVKNLEKHRCLLMTPSLSIFDLRAKQDVWFRNTELNYNCRLFAIDDRWRKRRQ
jgi:replicative DNA helicase